MVYDGSARILAIRSVTERRMVRLNTQGGYQVLESGLRKRVLRSRHKSGKW